MRYSKDHKERTRKRILSAAGKVFRRQGYQGGGVDAVMREAGLTHGGFYAHFRNKEDLFAAAIRDAAMAMAERRRTWSEGLEGADWIRSQADSYLAPRHRQRAEVGCPLPPLVSEVGRAGEPPKRAFEQVLLGWRDDIARRLVDADAEPAERDRAFAVIALLSGGLALSRAVADEELADRILEQCRHAVDQLTHPTTPTDPPETDP